MSPGRECTLATGLWTAVSGAKARTQTVDAVANNLSNADTLGFKRDIPTFKEYLSVLEREQQAQDVPRGPIKDKDFYPLDGRDQAFVVVDGTNIDFRQGNLKVTQGTLDLALDGPGFLEVSTPSGVRYTRQGSLKLATDGRLVTSEGYPVLATQPGGLANALPSPPAQPGQGGPLTQGGVAAGQTADVAARFINLSDFKGPLAITESGELFAGKDLVAQLSVTEFQDLNGLRKVGNGLFENNRPGNLIAQREGEIIKTKVRQGMLETSNVNPVEEMTNLIKANRLYELDMKGIKTYNDLMGKESNEIGKL